MVEGPPVARGDNKSPESKPCPGAHTMTEIAPVVHVCNGISAWCTMHFFYTLLKPECRLSFYDNTKP